LLQFVNLLVREEVLTLGQETSEFQEIDILFFDDLEKVEVNVVVESNVNDFGEVQYRLVSVFMFILFNDHLKHYFEILNL